MHDSFGVDPSVAPAGRHLMSMFIQYAPYKLKGATWDELRDPFADRCFDLLDEYAPNFKRSVLARQVLTPLDLRANFQPDRREHLPGGHALAPAICFSAGAGLCRLSHSHSRALPLWRCRPPPAAA